MPASPFTTPWLCPCCSTLFLLQLPVGYSSTLSLTASDDLLICGWMGTTFMMALLEELDDPDQGLPKGSRVTLLNEHKWTPQELGGRGH